MQQASKHVWPGPPVLLLLASLACVGSLQAQDSVSQLRQQASRGQVAQVLGKIELLLARKDASYEQLELGVELAIKSGALKQAFHLIGRMRQRKPDDPGLDTWEGHATVRQAQKSRVLQRATYADAAILYGQARGKGGDAYTNGLWEADAAFLAERWEQALAAADAALSVRGGDRAALLMRVRSLLKLDRASDAARTAAGLWQRFRADPEIARWLLKARLAVGDLARCRSTFVDLIDALPGNLPLYEALFAGLKDGGREALLALQETLQAVLDAHPQASFPIFYLASVASLDGNFKQSLVLYERYRDRFPRDGAGHLYVGALETRLGLLDQARRSLLRASELGNVEPQVLAHHLRGLVAAFVTRNAWARAQRLQELVIALVGEADDLLNLAAIQIAVGDQRGALRTYKGLLNRDELDFRTQATAENNLGLLLLGEGRKDEALAAFDRALEADDECWDALENRAVLKIRLGRKKEALADLLAVVAGGGERDTTRARYHIMRLRHAALLEGR